GVVHAPSHLLRCLDRERQAQDVPRPNAPLDQLDDRKTECLGLACPGPGRNPHCASEPGQNRALLLREFHSGTSPPKWRGQIRLNSHHLQSASADWSKCSSTIAAMLAWTRSRVRSARSGETLWPRRASPPTWTIRG